MSALLGFVMIFTLSITAFADEIDRTAIKNKLFEYIWTEEMADEEEFQPAEQNPVVAFAYGQVSEFIDSLTDREINRYNISDPETTREYTIRQVRKNQFDEWCEKNYDHWFVDYDENNNVWIMETKEYGDLTFSDDQAEWRLFDKDNNVVKIYRKPTNLSFLKNDNSEEITTSQDDVNPNESHNATVSAPEGPVATGSDNNSNESESSSEINTVANKDNSKVYIILTIVVIIAGVGIIIYYTKRKDTKK